MPIHFAASPGPSLGVEMELAIIDPESRELVKGAHELLIEMGEGHPDGVHPKAKAELLQSTIEIITGVCHSVAEARADLAATLDEVTEQTARRNLLLMCAGTHPFSDPVHQEITPNDRYRRLVAEMQWPARQMQIFGISNTVYEVHRRIAGQAARRRAPRPAAGADPGARAARSGAS